MTPLRAIGFAAFVLSASGAAFGQCCSPGNPSSGNQLLGSGGKGAVRLLSFYQFGYSDTYFRGSSPSDFRVYENARYHFGGLRLDYGWTSRTLAHFDLGYFPSRVREHSNPNLTENAPGPSNGIVGLRRIFLPFSGTGIGWEAGAGLKFPLWLGPVTKNGRVLSEEIQPSTRAFGMTADAAAQWGLLPYGLRFIAYLRYEFNFANPDEYTYGDLIAPMILATWSRWGFIAGQQGRWEWRRPDLFKGREQSSSGSKVLWWEPELGYEFHPAFRLALAGGIPLYRDYRGTQLAPKYTMQVKAMFLIPGSGVGMR